MRQKPTGIITIKNNPKKRNNTVRNNPTGFFDTTLKYLEEIARWNGFH